MNYGVIQARSALGLSEEGVREGAATLLSLGLLEGKSVLENIILEAPHGSGRVFNDIRNHSELRDYTAQLASAVRGVRSRSSFPLVIGGDCSTLFGCLLALRREPRSHGLVTLDGHADFYSPRTSPTREAADMDIALVTGKVRPRGLFGAFGTLVEEQHVYHVGLRDEAEYAKAKSPDIYATHITAVNATHASAVPPATLAARIRRHMSGLAGYWVHFDVDVLDATRMYAVDYELPGGLAPDFARDLLHDLLPWPCAGLSVAIYNPLKDHRLGAEFACGRLIAEVVRAALPE